MSRRKKGQECNADNSHACLSEIEGSFQTLLNAKNQRKENAEAALHSIIVVKNARVRAREEMSRYNAIPWVVCGGRDYSCMHPPCGLDSTKSRGDRG